MALNFPNSPSDGDTYTYDGITYEWNDSKKRWQKLRNPDMGNIHS